MQLTQHLRQKRRNHVSLPGRVSAQGRNCLGFDTGDLDFDVEESARSEFLQNFLERREPEIVRRSFTENFAARNRIVTDNSLPVRTQAHIEFEAVAAVLEAQLKRRDRIFGNVAGGTGSAMAKNK